MSKSKFIIVRVKPSMKEAVARIAKERGTSVTRLIMDALLAREPKIVKEQRKIDAEPLNREEVL